MEQRYPKAKGEAIDTSAVNIVTHVRQLHANFDQNPESKVGYIYQRNNNSSNINCNNNNINKIMNHLQQHLHVKLGYKRTLKSL